MAEGLPLAFDEHSATRNDLQHEREHTMDKTTSVKARILVRKAGSRSWKERLVVAKGPSVKLQPCEGFSAEQMQGWVTGMFAAAPIGNGLVALVDEGGMLKQLMHNCIMRVHGRPTALLGTVVIVRDRDGAYVGLEPGDDDIVRAAEVTFS